MKVTLVSGFLGSGKTSLLQHVLTKKDQNVKCAVIVNEISEFNIDALAVENAQLLKQEEKMVEMSNGCICCTLREDLLAQLNELHEAGFDAALIESSGIAEPMQVAETFFFPFTKDSQTGKVIPIDIHAEADAEQEEEHHHGGVPEKKKGQQILQDIAPLDNCVTIVDASTLTQHMQAVGSTHLLNKEIRAPEDEHNIATLMFDQLEFANVVVLNKIDTLKQQGKESVESLTTLIKRVNPNCKMVIPTTQSHVDLKYIVNTGNFDEKFARKTQGWMEDVTSGLKHVPETEEYGVSSISYTPKVPFHPQRLHEWFHKYFDLEETEVEDGEDEEEEDEEIEGELEDEDDEVGEDEEQQEEDDEKEELSEEEKAQLERWNIEVARRAAERTKRYGNLFRGKGYCWLGQPRRYDIFASWGQAGNNVKFEAQGVWQEFPQNNSPEPIEVEPGQRLIFIGQDLKKKNLVADLDACLLTPEENKRLEEVVEKRYKLDDPYSKKIKDDVFPDPFVAFNLGFGVAGDSDEEEEEAFVADDHEEKKKRVVPPAAGAKRVQEKVESDEAPAKKKTRKAGKEPSW